MNWQILHTKAASAEHNMSKDQELLNHLSFTKKPILHFYEWKRDSATYGYFIKPEQYLNLDAAEQHGLQLARRPTGGGIIFHTHDFAFSMLVPAAHPAYSLNTLDNYAFVNAFVAEAVRVFSGSQNLPKLLSQEPVPLDPSCRHFCMAKPTKYDVMLDGRKVGGGAQRRTKEGFLHQGTIALALPEEKFLEKILLPGTCVADAMASHSYLLLGKAPTRKQVLEARQELQKLLVQAIL